MEREILPSGEAEKELVHRGIQKYNARFMTECGDFSFHIQEDGRVIAGIVAESTQDLLEVEFLFVEEGHRGQGLGRKLLKQAEDAARSAGVKRVLLNTYSFQAPNFYEKMGYTQLLKIASVFGGHDQFFFMKELSHWPDKTGEVQDA